MNKQAKESIYLKEAIAIGNQLITKAQNNSHGIFWESMDSEDIYSGASGICLFLLELSKQTGNSKYLQTAQGVMQWVEWYSKTHPAKSFALLTGRMGVSYTFLKLFENTNNKAYLTKALKIAKDSKKLINDPHNIYEFINGVSGTLLGLLHLYAATQEQWLLKIINEYTQELIKNAKYAKVGLYWDVNYWQIRPLCGFSHGTSGIGFVFLELGHYFQNSAFYFIAEQAFAYENYYFDKKINNWPDLRINLYTEENIKKFETFYKKSSFQHFTKATDMNAWCYGAGGIGLSRLRAWEVSKENYYKIDIQKAYVKNLSSSIPSFTLCHGQTGIAEFFIENFLTFHNRESLEEAKKIALAYIKHKKSHDHIRDDLSLFSGIAGIGYFLLRLHDSKNTPSILAPKLTTQTTQKHPLTLPQIKFYLIENIFPRTLQTAKRVAPQQITEYFTIEDTSKESFIQFIKTLVSTLSQKEKEELSDIFRLEVTKIKLREKIKSQALLYIKDRIDGKKIQEILKKSDNFLLKQFLISPPECVIVMIKGDPFLLKQSSVEVTEVKVSQFCAKVLESFKKAKMVEEALENIITSYSIKDDNDKKIVQENVMQQIKEALTYGILLVKSK